MADSNVDLIINQISTILSARVDQVVKYLPRYLDKHTTLSIFWKGATYESATVNSKFVNYRFILTTSIYMYNEVEVQTTQKDLALNMVDDLFAKPDLNGSCLYHTIESVDCDFEMSSKGTYALIQIVLIATKEEFD